MDHLKIEDVEATTAGRLAKMLSDYYPGGAGDEITLGDHRAPFNRLKVLSRYLVAVKEREMVTHLLSEHHEPTLMLKGIDDQVMGYWQLNMGFPH